MDAAELKTTVVPITDTISVKMKYPTYDDVMKNTAFMKDDANTTDVLFSNIVICMHAVQTEEDNILISQEPMEEIDKFITDLFYNSND